MYVKSMNWSGPARAAYNYAKHEADKYKKTKWIKGPMGTKLGLKRSEKFAQARAKPTPKPVKSKPKGSFRTTGSSYRKIKKLKRSRPFQFHHRGSVKVIERGDVHSDTNAVYVGLCNAPFVEVMKAACRAIIKALVQQHGFSFQDWNETSGDITDGAIAYRYFTSTGAVNVSQQTITFPTIDFGVSTYDDIANALYTSIVSTFSTDTNHTFREFILYKASTSPSDADLARIMMSDFTLVYECTGSMKLQNRTLANTSAEADDDDMGNIENNPIHGKIYMCKNLSGFEPRVRLSEAGYEGFTADPSTGIIKTDAASSCTSLGSKKPVLPAFFRKVDYHKAIKIMPGEIRYFKTVFKRSIKWNTLFRDYIIQTNAPTTAMQTKFGNTFMFGLEKMLDTRSSEPSVNVGYETNVTIKCGYKYKKNLFTNSIVEVN